VVTRASPLRGRGAERPRDAGPRDDVGMGSREMQDDPTDRADDVDADRDQRLPQPRDLRTAERGPVGAKLQLLEEDEGRGRQRDAQLIGPEARATGTPEGEGVFKFLQPILAIAARAIDVRVDPFGRLAQIGDDKARVIARLAPLVPHDFRFDDRAPGRRPGAGLIGRLAIGGRGVVGRGHHRPERRDVRLGVPREDGVTPHGDDILDPGRLQVGQDLRGGKPAIEPDAEAGTGKGAPEFPEQPMQQAHHAGRPRRVAGPEDRGDQVLPRLLVKRQGPDERQIAPVIIEAIEEGELLRAVGLVFRAIEIDRDQANAPSASAMSRNHRVGERLAHREQHPWGGRVLEARDRRLRRQAAAVDRIAPQQQLVDGIVGEPVRVIAVGMATRDREDPLREQIADAVRHARRRARIGDRRGEGRQQAEVSVGRFEQHRAAVRTRVGLIKGRDQGAIDQVRKQNSLCYRRLVQRNRLRVGKRRLVNSVVRTRGRLCFSETRSLVNYPG